MGNALSVGKNIAVVAGQVVVGIGAAVWEIGKYTVNSYMHGGKTEQEEKPKEEKPQPKPKEEKPQPKPKPEGDVPEHFHDNDELAAKANVHRDRARKLRDDAHNPEFKDRKNELYEQANAEDAKASKLVFDTLNAKQPKGTIDLHLQFVAEATRICEEQYNKLKGSVPEIVFIVGRGNHSEGGKCVLEPAVLEWAKEKGLKTSQDVGKVIVQL